MWLHKEFIIGYQITKIIQNLLLYLGCLIILELELVMIKERHELFQKAANLGNADGIYNLGYCYYLGIGTTVD